MDDKSAYRQKLEAQLDEWRAEIDKLQAKAVEAGADARIEYEEQVEELRDQQKWPAPTECSGFSVSA